ncbi:MAG TPA: transcriptional regulator [Firmicutes bacterium]|nr:transcriptional regulator [Bacillota bacterium]
MGEEIRQLAARIREIREIEGITLEALAEELNITVDLYQRYEAGTDDIPVGVLYKIAQRFNLELSALITGEEPRLRSYSLTRKGRGVSVQRRKAYKYQSLAYNFIHKKAEPFLVTVEPHAEEGEIKLNNHPGQEFNYLLSGTIKFLLNGYEVTLNPGDSIYFDSGIDHGMIALNGEPAQFLAVIL